MENKKTFQLTIGNKVAFYNGREGIVYYSTKNGIKMECEVPEDWGFTRIVQFMESLIKADSVII